MNRAHVKLLAKRQELVRRAATQRHDLVHEFDGLGRTLFGAERVLRVVDTLGGKVPQVALGAAAAALLFGPAKLSGWAGTAWMIWQIVRGFIGSKRPV